MSSRPTGGTRTASITGASWRFVWPWRGSPSAATCAGRCWWTKWLRISVRHVDGALALRPLLRGGQRRARRSQLGGDRTRRHRGVQEYRRRTRRTASRHRPDGGSRSDRCFRSRWHQTKTLAAPEWTWEPCWFNDRRAFSEQKKDCEAQSRNLRARRAVPEPNSASSILKRRERNTRRAGTWSFGS